ncbi:interleukin 2 receptor, gamma a precursor [Silurus asotus]|uniref:Interleukin 2 receptor, gamma a n=1 Tax=Silurus asotus TaxID=30991 RepID=A0AAD5AE25_SILAS|nr:interleukin 2 receptor, gamma a precursor [Silurus asotus]
MFFSGFLVLVWICRGSASTLPHQIECTVVNLEYITCRWDANRTLVENYIFRSSFKKPVNSSECSSYQYEGAVRVGCVVPYSEKQLQRFDSFFTSLYTNQNTIITSQEYGALLKRDKLAPNVIPDSFKVLNKLATCLNNWMHVQELSYRSSEEVSFKKPVNSSECSSYQYEGAVNSGIENKFTVPFPNTQTQYEFQVRVRMSSVCGESELWSEWSEPVFWGSMKEINDTESIQTMSAGLMVFCTIGAAVLLIILTCLLIHSERLRVILVPVVPSPKNLGDLIDSYGGNVEKWLHISKELQDGFKPNFSERPCTVREFRTETHSESESDDSLSVHTAVSSDYQSMKSFSSTSTLPSHPDSPCTETTPLSGL